MRARVCLQFEAWQRAGRLKDLVRYHVVSCETLTLSDLKTTNQAVSTSGYTLQFTTNQVIYTDMHAHGLKTHHANTQDYFFEGTAKLQSCYYLISFCKKKVPGLR